MSAKYSSAIKSITLNRATFENVPVEHISFVNFFYGNNGTGKTSIARTIMESDPGVIWEDGHSADDYDVLVYNQEFISKQFSEHENVRGVYTVNETNIEIQNEVNDKSEKKRELDESLTETVEDIAEMRNALERIEEVFRDKCWEESADIRRDFDKALRGKKQKKLLAAAILTEQVPAEHDIDALKELCDVAYDDSSTSYSLFSKGTAGVSFDAYPGIELMGKSITVRSESDFSRFIKKIKAMDWVKDGHDHYTEDADGKCPFCQQTLPNDFEESIAACFDAQYQEDIDKLHVLQNAYVGELEGFVTLFQNNMQNAMPALDLQAYTEKVRLLEGLLETNRQLIAKKVNTPSAMIDLKSVDTIIAEIHNVIDELNIKIKTNNDAVTARGTSRETCETNIMQHLAFMMKDAIKDYYAEKKKVTGEVSSLEAKQKQTRSDISTLTVEIAQLNSQIVNTQDAIDGVNRILKDSGFQGFSMKPKDGVASTYEVIRENGEIADDLSEGELHFIAFLYFYHLVRGSFSRDEVKEKIVVIDDPVSSMDSGALFIVSTIVQEMVDSCREHLLKSGDRIPPNRIRQMFILTHNVYFHREITYRQMRNFRDTTFFLITKSDNKSAVKACIKERTDVAGGELINYNPVQSSYSALWDELKEVKTANTLRSVMRRILEHYFLQLCGYDGKTLREVVLADQENSIKEEKERKVATALLQYIDNPQGINDGMYFADEFDDPEAYKRVFQTIFSLMKQDQHYNMMTNRWETES